MLTGVKNGAAAKGRRAQYRRRSYFGFD